MTTIDLTARYQQSSIVHVGKQWAIHHTATPTPAASATVAAEVVILNSIDRFHREVRKFITGIGYHVAVFPSGRSYRVGRQGTQRAHVLGLNHLYDGLVFVGTFTRSSSPSPAALDEAARVIRESGMDVAGGHGELPGQGTECPGGWPLALLYKRVEAPAPVAALTSYQRTIMESAARFAGLGSVRITPDGDAWRMAPR